MDENKYLEEFLISAQSKIDDLSVTTDSRNMNDYKYLIIDFEGMTYKVENSLVKNYTNLMARMNRDEMEIGTEEVDPYRNLGKIKAKSLVVDSSVISDEEKLSELLEKIVSKIYEKYNFLILPQSEEEVEEIITDDYIKSPYETKSTQEKSQGQNLYSIGFKIKAEADQGTEYFPLKIYFRIFKKENGDLGVKIAEEFNSIAKSSQINVLTNHTFSSREKAKLKKRFENNEFAGDKELISSNIDKIINQLLLHVSEYVDDFDHSPVWFQNTELGKYLRKASLQADIPQVHATASFRYITQTPLPYSYVTVRLRNIFGNQEYQVKRASESNKELNEMLNTCPICAEPITPSNRLVSSDEYEKDFIGCEHCMDQKCSQCASIWSSKKEPLVINKKVGSKYYHVAGMCNSPLEYCSQQDCFGTSLCSIHSKRCYDPLCDGNIYCEKVIVKCSNHDCDKTYCLEHENKDLYKCETSVCANKQFPNKYCEVCKDTYLNTCKYCGKTMCQDCSRPVMVQNKNGRFELSQTDFICLDCLNLMTKGKNKEMNIANGALVRAESGEYYPKSMQYLEKYADVENIFIDKTIATLAYKQKKPLGWENNPTLGKLWYKDEDITICQCCGQPFHMTRPSAEDKKSHYCDDCLVNCSLCGSLMVTTHVVKYDNKYYCKKCFNDKWEISDLDFNGDILPKEKEQIAQEVFADSSVSKIYKIVPVSKEELFICPDTKYHVSKDQKKTCTSCHETYALSNFEKGESKCKLCLELQNFDYNPDKNLLISAFYQRSYGDKSRFQVYVSENTLLIRHSIGVSDVIDVYHFDKKSGKYKEANVSDGIKIKPEEEKEEEKEVTEHAE